MIENIVGRDFLPRGAGVVTRRPTILQLHTHDDEYAEFLHLPGRRYTESRDIKAEIARSTHEEVGDHGVSEKPITIRYYSPVVLNVTLVDLPGMIKFPTANQPEDIVDRIHSMVMRYVEPPNVVILAVSPANVDLANSDAMKVARTVDPEGNRTIGVITKLDLMDAGTDARQVLAGQVFPLKLGYVGVVNRSQQDIDHDKSISAAVDAEESYFSEHDVYKHLDNTGTRHLQWRLNRELKKHIFHALPKLRADLNSKLYSAQREQEQYEEAVTPEKAKTRMTRCIRAFEKDVKADVQGALEHLDASRVAAGPHINALFFKEFAAALALYTPGEHEMRRTIAVTISNLRGYHINIFTPYDAFRSVVRTVLENFRIPIKACVDAVATTMDEAVRRAAHYSIQRYPRLMTEILHQVTAYLDQQQREVGTTFTIDQFHEAKQPGIIYTKS